jgi:diguanylate cyclase (GGDEF)-like protein
MESKQIKGWLLALFSILVLWGLNNVMISYSAKVLEVNYLVYTCCAFISGSTILLLIGGLKDDLAKETLRSPDSLIFGVIMLLGYLLTLSLFFFTSATEGAFLQRISMVFSVFIAWFFMQRKPNIFNLIGSLFVLFGIFMICSKIPSENRGIIYILIILEGALLTARTFTAETHMSYNKAMLSDDPKLKKRVIGFVMFLVSMAFLISSFIFALIQTYSPIVESSTIIPTLSDFYNYKSILAGLVAGIILVAPLRLIEFYSTNTIKSENLLAISAFSPFATLFWSWLFEPLTGLSVASFSTNDWIAGLIITFGCLLAAIYQIYRTKKYGTEKWRDYVKEHDDEDMYVSNTKDIVKKALNHCQNNYALAADSLGITQCTIKQVLENKNYAFKDHVNSHIMANFKENIANIDALTKISNRSGFYAYGDQLVTSSSLFSLLFIDLDKFKPVNDTYGHEAGDKVLQIIAKRLHNLNNDDIKVARLAGDEFVILFNNYEKQHLINHLKDFEKIINQKIAIIDETKVQVDASFGFAQFPADGKNLDDLLDYADKRMYSHKNKK